METTHMNAEGAHSQSETTRTIQAVIYCRISRDRVGAGLGVDRQEQECRQLAERLGWTVITVYRDNDLSAYSGKPRPGYLQMLDAVKSGAVDVVLAWHTDRLHRSPVELETYIATCEKHAVPTHTAKAGPLDLATPSGRLVARQLGAVARYEVEHAIERQRAAKDQAAASGEWPGGRRPYGYEADGLTVRPDEAAAIVVATDAVLLGVSLRAQVAKMNLAGLRTSTGRPWAPTELKRVLIRPRNAGLRQHRGLEHGKAAWPAIVEEDKWRAARSLLTDPDRRTNEGRATRWLLSGLARCGVCGSALLVTLLVSPRKSINSYSCKVGKCVVRNASELEEYISLIVVERLSRPDAIMLLQPRTPGVDLSGLRAEAAALQTRIDDLADDIDLNERVLARRTKALKARLDQVTEELAAAGSGSVLSGVVDAPDVEAAWAALDLDRKRAIISGLMQVTVNRTRKGRKPGWRPGQSYFDPSAITIEWRR